MGLLDKFFGPRDDKNIKYSTIDYNEYFDAEVFDEIPLEFLHLGELNLPTGQIIACDPLVTFYDAVPFTYMVQPGIYPVTACIAKTANAGNRFAAVKLKFTNQRATLWQMALVEGQDVSEITSDDQFFGFGVDAGLGCLSDTETQEYYNQWETDIRENNPGRDVVYNDFIAPAFKRNAKDPNNHDDIGDWLNFELPNKPELNIIMFTSGYGDGFYPSYWGITDEGNICSLVVDLQVF